MMPDNKSVEQIKLDLARTLTHHRMFEEKNGEGQQKLLRVLKAYSYYNTTVGYCQGMSYLAAILLTVLPEEEAFQGMCVVVGGMEVESQPFLVYFFAFFNFVYQRDTLFQQCGSCLKTGKYSRTFFANKCLICTHTCKTTESCLSCSFVTHWSFFFFFLFF
jgi:hypothetical protein